jgi:hypothetical protein
MCILHLVRPVLIKAPALTKSDLIDEIEATYQGNFAGVQLLKKRERRGEIEYFVKWKGRPEVENSWEKEDTIHRERILEFEAR